MQITQYRYCADDESFAAAVARIETRKRLPMVMVPCSESAISNLFGDQRAPPINRSCRENCLRRALRNAHKTERLTVSNAPSRCGEAGESSARSGANHPPGFTDGPCSGRALRSIGCAARQPDFSVLWKSRSSSASHTTDWQIGDELTHDRVTASRLTSLSRGRTVNSRLGFQPCLPIGGITRMR
jgi:hypothetical protein